MHCKSIVSIAAAAVAALGFAPLAGHAAPGMPGALTLKKPLRFAAIKPLLDAKCLKCHNDKSATEGVNVSSYAALMKSSVAVPGHPEKSKLILYVDGTRQPRMPFKAKPLTPSEIVLLKDWVKQGAKD